MCIRDSSYSYAPFGEVTQRGNITNPLQWSSEVFDGELGLVYYNYRHYTPHDGRWISRDPIAEQEELNLYAFVRNNPATAYDRWGNTGIYPRDVYKRQCMFCCCICYNWMCRWIHTREFNSNQFSST